MRCKISVCFFCSSRISLFILSESMSKITSDERKIKTKLNESACGIPKERKNVKVAKVPNRIKAIEAPCKKLRILLNKISCIKADF